MNLTVRQVRDRRFANVRLEDNIHVQEFREFRESRGIHEISCTQIFPVIQYLPYFAADNDRDTFYTH